MARKKMTEKEKQDWESLYFYVKNLLGYDENQALSNTMVLRLKGLLTNKFIENGNIESTANYSYEVILNTFKFCTPEINRMLSKKDFYTEEAKFNYICAIVESNLNTVYMRMQSAEKAKEKIENMKTDIFDYNGAEYKSRNTVSDKFADFW